MGYITSLPGLLIAIVFHEFAHGYVAYRLGDNTAKEMGRLSLNPLKHLDPLGFLSMLIFRFGWAKPVPINSRYFKNRKRDIFLVSIAGIVTNFLIAIITALLLRYLPIRSQFVANVLLMTLWYNVMLGIFNLLPFPPLDGSKILASFLPDRLEYLFYKYERYFYVILILLIVSDFIDLIMSPIINSVLNMLFKLIML